MKTIRASVWMNVVAAGCLLVAPHPGKAQMELAAAATGAPQVKGHLVRRDREVCPGRQRSQRCEPRDKSMLGMVGEAGGGKDWRKAAGLADKMDFVVVHSYTYDKPGMYRMEDVEVFRKKLTDGSWTCFVHTRDRSGSTDVCKKSDVTATELVVIKQRNPKNSPSSTCAATCRSMNLMKMHGNPGDAIAPPAPPSPPSPPTPARPSAAPAAPAAPRP